MTLLEAARAFIPSEDVITLASAIAAFLAVCAVWSGMVEHGGTASRAKVLRRRQSELRRNAMAPTGNQVRRSLAMGLMRRAVRRLNLLRHKQAAAMARRLASAGWRGSDAMVIYLFARLALPLACGGAAILVIYRLDLSIMARFGIAAAAVLIGAYLPDLLVKNQTQKRQEALRKGLPDSLDLLVICAEAGLGLEAALTRVGREMERGCPEISDEINMTAAELGFLPDRRRALANLAQRTNLPAIRAVVNTLIQTEKYGTPLAQSLRVLAAEFRDDRLMRAEEKAARLPAVLTVPLVLFIMPSLFIVLLGPAVLRAIDGLSGLR